MFCNVKEEFSRMQTLVESSGGQAGPNQVRGAGKMLLEMGYLEESWLCLRVRSSRGLELPGSWEGSQFREEPDQEAVETAGGTAGASRSWQSQRKGLVLFIYIEYKMPSIVRLIPISEIIYERK